MSPFQTRTFENSKRKAAAEKAAKKAAKKARIQAESENSDELQNSDENQSSDENQQNNDDHHSAEMNDADIDAGEKSDQLNVPSTSSQRLAELDQQIEKQRELLAILQEQQKILKQIEASNQMEMPNHTEKRKVNVMSGDSSGSRILPPFDTRMKSGDPKIWLNRYEEIANYMGWSNYEKNIFLISNLVGDALEWYQKTATEYDFESFKQEFCERFKKNHTERDLFHTINFNWTEGFHKFFQQRKKYAISAGIEEEYACKLMIDDLPPRMNLQLTNPLPRTFNDLERIGLNIERALKNIHKEEHTKNKSIFKPRPVFNKARNYQQSNYNGGKKQFKPFQPRFWCANCFKRTGRKLPHRTEECRSNGKFTKSFNRNGNGGRKNEDKNINTINVENNEQQQAPPSADNPF